MTGTHKGENIGIPPSGRSIAYDEIFIYRFVDDRIVEIWGVVDVVGQMRQLGLIRTWAGPSQTASRLV